MVAIPVAREPLNACSDKLARRIDLLGRAVSRTTIPTANKASVTSEARELLSDPSRCPADVGRRCEDPFRCSRRQPPERAFVSRRSRKATYRYVFLPKRRCARWPVLKMPTWLAFG